MSTIEKRIHVYKAFRTMGLDFREDPSGFIYADHDQLRVWFPEEDPGVIRVTFEKDVDAGYAGDMAIRFEWPLQLAGFIIVVDAGYFEPTHQV